MDYLTHASDLEWILNQMSLEDILPMPELNLGFETHSDLELCSLISSGVSWVYKPALYLVPHLASSILLDV